MHTYVNHAHVTYGTVVLVLGVLGLLLGIVRKIIVVVVLAVVLVVVGAVVAGVALHGTHCTPGSTRSVCVTVR